MVCIYGYNSISKIENIFVPYKSQHDTRQALNEVLHVPYTYSTKAMHSITYSGPRIFNTVPVNIRICESCVTLSIFAS